MRDEVVVVSTAFAPDPAQRRQCELSILGQSVPVQHVYIDAAESGGVCSENLYSIIHNLTPETIVFWVDGDDWLANEAVVARVLREYQRGAWLTWGQFRYADGFAGWAAPSDGRPPRHQPWCFTHLKTFRAGLFQQIALGDLQRSRSAADWVTRAVDQAVMFPMLEMAGPGRGAFIPEVLYIYSGRNTTAPVEDENTEARRIRAMTPYKRLEKKPW
jgi:hypothetical protein